MYATDCEVLGAIDCEFRWLEVYCTYICRVHGGVHHYHQHEENWGISQPLFTVYKEYHSSSSLVYYARENLKLFSGYIQPL